jgi:hypothetical protein
MVEQGCGAEGVGELRSESVVLEALAEEVVEDPGVPE